MDARSRLGAGRMFEALRQGRNADVQEETAPRRTRAYQTSAGADGDGASRLLTVRHLTQCGRSLKDGFLNSHQAAQGTMEARVSWTAGGMPVQGSAVGGR